MPNLAEPTPPSDPIAHRGVVVKAPAELGDPFTVRVPDFDDLHVFEIRRWEYRGATLPAVDDEVLVVVDDEAEPWVAAWWPAAGDSPIGVGPEGPAGPEGKQGPEGPKGAEGAKGAEGRWAGLRYAYLTNTEETEPAAGKLKFNAGKTALYISETDGDGGGIGAYLATWDDSTTTGTRGFVIVRKIGTPATWATYKVTGALTDKGAWDTLPVALVASNGAFANEDAISVEFYRTGDKGEQGEKGATGEKGEQGEKGEAGTPGSADYKDSVRAATVANITIATALNNADSLDGVVLATGDRVLVKNQAETKENGIWVVGAVPARAEDADAAGELSGGAQVYVEAGTRNKRRVFYITTTGSITPGTTAHSWAQLFARDFGIVEALPTSEAVIGDMCTYKAAAGIYWELVYTNEDETYPWNPRGRQMELINIVAGGGARNAATYGDCTGGVLTVPTVTTPLKGTYRIEHGAIARLSGGASSNAYVSVEVGAAAAVNADAARHVGIDQFEGSTIRSHPIEKTALAAATAIKQKYKGETNTLTWEYESRWVSITPVRVG